MSGVCAMSGLCAVSAGSALSRGALLVRVRTRVCVRRAGGARHCGAVSAGPQSRREGHGSRPPGSPLPALLSLPARPGSETPAVLAVGSLPPILSCPGLKSCLCLPSWFNLLGDRCLLSKLIPCVSRHSRSVKDEEAPRFVSHFIHHALVGSCSNGSAREINPPLRCWKDQLGAFPAFYNRRGSVPIRAGS